MKTRNEKYEILRSYICQEELEKMLTFKVTLRETVYLDLQMYTLY